MTNAQTRENLAIEYGSNATHAAAHTADPGSGMTNEVSGGSYARQALTWTAGAVDGEVTASATFDIPSGTSVSHVTTTDAATGGSQIDKVTATYNSQPNDGTLTVNFTYTQS